MRAAPTIVQTNKNRRARAAAFYLALRLCDRLFWLSFRRCEACWPLEATIVNARAARYAQTSVHVESHKRHFSMTEDMRIQRSSARRRSTRKPHDGLSRLSSLAVCFQPDRMRTANHGIGTNWPEVSTVERCWIVIAQEEQFVVL